MVPKASTMSLMTDDVLARLKLLQGERTDAQMGGLLGVSRSHWGHIRSGRRTLTYDITKRAVRVFPELYPVVVQDIAGTVTMQEAAR